MTEKCSKARQHSFQKTEGMHLSVFMSLESVFFLRPCCDSSAIHYPKHGENHVQVEHVTELFL